MSICYVVCVTRQLEVAHLVFFFLGANSGILRCSHTHDFAIDTIQSPHINDILTDTAPEKERSVIVQGKCATRARARNALKEWFGWLREMRTLSSGAKRTRQTRLLFAMSRRFILFRAPQSVDRHSVPQCVGSAGCAPATRALSLMLTNIRIFVCDQIVKS